MPTIRDLAEEGRRRLRGAVSDSPGREARLLLGHLLDLGEAALMTREEQEIDAAIAARFFELVDRRGRGEPAAYLRGRREFFGRDFAVDDRVLIPRPETEGLVELALALDLPRSARVLDVGTGSGVIALTLAAERPAWTLVGTDLSLSALACARGNRARLGLDPRVALAQMDLASALALERFDLVVSNPPYVDPAEPALLAADVRSYEPHLALFAERQGLARIEELLDAARALTPGAALAFEFGFGQRDAVLELAARRSWLVLVEVRDDTAGIPRDMVFRRAPAR